MTGVLGWAGYLWFDTFLTLLGDPDNWGLVLGWKIALAHAHTSIILYNKQKINQFSSAHLYSISISCITGTLDYTTTSSA
jgi:hypothetical protein